jgi:hypothetical protein
VAAAPVPEDDDDEDLLCGEPAPARIDDKDDGAEAYFSRGTLGPFLLHAVARTDRAAEVFTRLDPLPLQCTWEETEAGGDVSSWRLQAMAFPALGDESRALRLSAALDSGGFLEVETVYLRRGDVAAVLYIAWAGLFVPPQTDRALLERLARIAVERME